MISGAISHLVQLLFWVDGISIIMANLATIIKGVLTLRKVRMAPGKISQPIQKICGEGVGGAATSLRGTDPYITTYGVIP